jgi:hypothetical protein
MIWMEACDKVCCSIGSLSQGHLFHQPFRVVYLFFNIFQPYHATNRLRIMGSRLSEVGDILRLAQVTKPLHKSRGWIEYHTEIRRIQFIDFLEL